MNAMQNSAAERSRSHDHASEDDACGLSALSPSLRLIAYDVLERGVAKGLKGYAIDAYADICDALRFCCRERCIAHKDCGDIVDELQGDLDASDALDEQWEAERAELQGAAQ